MTAARKDLAASVAAQLLNRAKATGDDYQTLFTTYALERFLYRLGASELRDRFILKGAMLLQLWSEHPYRATRDLDLLRQGDGSLEAIRSDLQAICAVQAVSDGIDFDPSSIRIEAVRAEDEYAGFRARLAARCGTARLPLQIDLGHGDSVWPAPRACNFPALLEFPRPDVLAYPREAVVAEKLEAVVVLGDRNSRIKDFFDLHYLASHFAFDRRTLAESVRRTFERRATPFPVDAPIGLTPRYWENPSRPAQVRAFARRAGLQVSEHPGADLGNLLTEFLLPLLEEIRTGGPSSGSWHAGGPWQTSTN